MPKRLLVDAVYPDEVRVAITDNGRVEEFDYETSNKKQIKGNIYLAKVTRVEPSLQAAFVEYGGDKHGFLPFSEVHPDYYQIPVSDRKRLMEEVWEENAKSKKPYKEEEGDDEVLGNEEKENNVNDSNESDDEEEVDIISGDEDDFEEEDIYLNKKELARRYKIQEVLKRNQVILVQVIKEERGNKGASLTTYIALAGRYCVLMPNNARQGGVSRRITSYETRKKLKSLISNLEIPDGASVIIRTAGSGRTKSEINRDYDYLVKLWNSIRELTLSSSAPAFVHAEGDLVKRSIRDMYDQTIDEVLVSGSDAYQMAKGFMKMIMPSHAAKVKHYRAKMPLFAKYDVESQLVDLYKPIATMPSGGYVVINTTEALISIDVNSGRSTSERNIEETAVKTNIEAAYEIARQMKLRDLSGLIVIDFIDMMQAKNRRTVERAFRDALQGDRAKLQLGRISIFGLLEMSRQRLRASFFEVHMTTCSHCSGKGYVRSLETTSVLMMRAIEAEIYRGGAKAVNIYASNHFIMYILNYRRDLIHNIERKHKIHLFFHADEEAGPDGFAIEKTKTLPAEFQGDSLSLTEQSDEEIEYEEISDEELEEDRKVIDEEVAEQKSSGSGGPGKGRGAAPKNKGQKNAPSGRKRHSNASAGAGNKRSASGGSAGGNARSAGSSSRRSPSSRSRAAGGGRRRRTVAKRNDSPSMLKGLWDRITSE